jgi:hypothetical protein
MSILLLGYLRQSRVTSRSAAMREAFSDYFKVVSFDLVVGSCVQPLLNGIKNGHFSLSELPEHGSLFFGEQIDWITRCAERG